MHSAWLRITFRRVLKFLEIKERGPNFLPEPILQKVWITWSPLLDFNFKSLMYTISLLFIRFQYILHDEGVLFAESQNFYKLKSGDLISWGNQFCRKSEWFGTTFCISISKALWTQIHSHSLGFNAFCIIQQYFFQSWSFYKLKSVDLISGWNQFSRKSELFGPPFCILILIVLWSQIQCHWLDFNAFYMIKD